MNLRQILGLGCAVLVALPLLAHAEVYKWKDKNGEIRYSDTPPPSNIKLEKIGRKKVAKPTGSAPLAPVVEAAKLPVAPAKAGENVGNKEDEAAKERQKKAEADKKNKAEKEKIDKIKEENCKTARGNLANYKQGGRLTRTNENGEREYIDDKSRKEGVEKAQQDIEENCS